MLGIGNTDVGKIRGNNEDSILVSNSPVGVLPNLYVVADGMGGHKAGEVASRNAIDFCCEYLNLPELKKGENLDALVDAVRFANDRLYDMSREYDEYSNMGTTFVGCCIDGVTAYIAHVGDSRLYKISGEEIVQITTDHSYVAEMIRAGRLTPEEAEAHPDKNIITRAVGTNPNVEIDGMVLNVDEKDILLICSDGLSNMLHNDEILNIVKNNGIPFCLKAEELVNAANEKGGKDNISAVLIGIGEGAEV
jgi:protein phosphatase